MSTRQLGFASIAVLAASFWLVSQSHVRGQDAPEGQEVLTHGPVHEAFAEPAAANPTATIVVPKQPPAAIEEMPPDVKPDGANVVWVAGYWAWDDTRNDYIWISGIWRDTPPNHVWVAGYWNQVADGFQWTPGFWSPAQQEQVNYLPAPPPTQESGPNIPQPGADDFWVPGYYQYVDTRYVWRPGYWTVGRPDWIWMPAHYVWTPSGYIFIAGHWDYALARRGVLFAPVYFSAPIYVRPRYVFAPVVVIEPSLLTVNFFVRPSYCHYYFGDYYGANFVSLGFSPWFSAGVRVGYDPLFTYYRWDHRGDRGWEVGVRDHFAYMRDHPDARPPRTFVQQTTIVNNITINKNSNVKNIAIGAPLNQYVRNANVNGGAKFVNVSNQQRQLIAQDAMKSQDIARERAKIEATPGGSKSGPLAGGAVPANRSICIRSRSPAAANCPVQAERRPRPAVEERQTGSARRIQAPATARRPTAAIPSAQKRAIHRRPVRPRRAAATSRPTYSRAPTPRSRPPAARAPERRQTAEIRAATATAIKTTKTTRAILAAAGQCTNRSTAAIPIKVHRPTISRIRAAKIRSAR